MNDKKIKEELIEICENVFQHYGINGETIAYADFVDDLGMDSITFISLIVEIEACFEIVIPDEVLLMENFKTLNSIEQLITNQLDALAANV